MLLAHSLSYCLLRFRGDLGLAASLHKAARLTAQLEQDPDLIFLLKKRTSPPKSQLLVPEKQWSVHLYSMLAADMMQLMLEHLLEDWHRGVGGGDRCNQQSLSLKYQVY